MAGVRNSKEKMMERLTRNLAQNEEQPLGVSFHYLTKQPQLTHSQPRNTQNCTLDGQKLDLRKWPNAKPAVWDSVLGSFKPIHPKHKEDKPWTWVATIRSEAPPQFMEQFRAMTSLHTEGVITIAAERTTVEVAQKSFKNHLISPRRLHDGRDYRSRGNGPAPGGKPA